MRIGFALPQMSSLASPEAVSKVAARAEELGFDSLWVLDRTLWPVNPRSPYPAGDGSLPVQYKRVLDPLATLTFAAAHTRRIALGTSVLNLPWYNPLLLARQLSTLDVLSGGRLRVGFGMGWSQDEYEAANAPWKERGKRADEALRVLKAIWTTDPVEFSGTYYRVPKSVIGIKPVQKPHPPIYMAAYTPGAMQRTAREANGWFPVGVPIKAVPQMFQAIQQMAREVGRDPAQLELIVRANFMLLDSPAGADRPDFVGTAEQIAADTEELRRMGCAEVAYDAQFSPGVDNTASMLSSMERILRISGKTK